MRCAIIHINSFLHNLSVWQHYGSSPARFWAYSHSLLLTHHSLSKQPSWHLTVFCSYLQRERCHAIYRWRICDILEVAVYVRHSPDVLCVKTHPLDLHFHSLTHMITCSHTNTQTQRMEGVDYFRNVNSLTNYTMPEAQLFQTFVSLSVWIVVCTRATEMNVLVLIISVAS